MSRRDEILRIEDLYVHFYTYAGVVKAIDGVNMSVLRGETYGLVGETGCGKSVTMRAVLRLIPPPGRIVKGRVIFNGVNLLELPEEEMRKIRGAKIAYIVQDPTAALDPLYTSGFQVAETILAHEENVGKKSVWERVVSLFKSVLIPDAERRVKQYPHEFSGGMRQRVVIACAISEKPELLIADEPTTSVDVTVQAQILEVLEDLKKTQEMTMILVTHNLGLVAQICDRVGVMYAGSIVEVSDVFRLFEEPLHPYTRGLLNAIPHVTRTQFRLEPIPGTIPDLINPPPGCRFHPRCKHATGICKREKPKLREIEPGRFVACHLYRGD
ncbi:MAG: ABC transporter ATP-binding protein [Thermoproteota archaeon]|nr:MAG: ABC transporter ATP-binding protein [Candidatus Korarchaeota archaeon]RLG56199.1 MAG: ABC transporter ATP-binding protein [Candidatus Korarchaeota archaeon]